MWEPAVERQMRRSNVRDRARMEMVQSIIAAAEPDCAVEMENPAALPPQPVRVASP